MKSRTSRCIVVIAFGLALVGGAAAGMLAMRLFPTGAPSQSVPSASLSDELQLTPTQRNQIRAIWEPLQSAATSAVADAQRLAQRRDDRIRDLLSTPEQQKAYAQINQQYQDEYAALKARNDRALHDAIERTRKLLDPSQRQKYDVILAGKLGRLGADHGQPAWLNAAPPAATRGTGGPTARTEAGG